jgi:D-amino-acid oxidase
MFDVTIYTKTVPPETTSNMSLAGFTPTTALINNDQRTAEWDRQFVRLTDLSYRQLQLMVGPNYGVYWMDTYNGSETPTPQRGPQGPQGSQGSPAATESDLLPEYLRPGHFREVLQPGEHPFPTKYAIRSTALSIEPSIYLDALVRDFLQFGGKIVIRTFDTPRDLATLAEPIVVNCSGLGSYTLFDDKALVPIKGQLTLLVPQPEVNYRASGRLPSMTAGASINPRRDGLVVGNLQDRGNWSLEPDEDVRQRNISAAIEYFSAMGRNGRRGTAAFG